MNDELQHHGIKNQKWGVRHGPPYPLKGGTYSASKYKKNHHSLRDDTINEKKHYDKTIKRGTTINTLSIDPNRTKNTEMFFAAYTPRDKAEYRALFNKPVKSANGLTCKYRIRNTVSEDIKVASEDSGIKEFKEIFKNDRDFYNFVTDPDRMRKAFLDERYKYSGYKETKSVLDAIDAGGASLTAKDVDKLYRMFNFTMMYDLPDVNPRLTDDVKQQREKFFKRMKQQGYSAVLDVNDSIYGGYKSQAPVILFDMEKIVPKDVMMTSVNDHRLAQLEFAFRKAFGL